MLLSVLDFLKTNWLWLTLGLVIIVCIIILLCTDTKKKGGELNVNEYGVKGKKENDAEESKREQEEAEANAAPSEEPAETAGEETTESGEQPAAESQEAEQQSEEAEQPAAEDAQSEQNETVSEQEDAAEEEPDEEDHSDVVVKSAKKGSARYRIVYDRDTMTWVIRKDGNVRAFRRVKTKREALEIAKELSAKNPEVSVSVHKKDGKFQKQ